MLWIICQDKNCVSTPSTSRSTIFVAISKCLCLQYYSERYNKMKRLLHQATLAVAVSAIAATLPSSLAPMRAQAQPLLLSQNVNFKPPQDVTAPSSRQGGTHRGSKLCPAGLSITPLVPPTNIGLPLTESPKIGRASCR